MKSIIRKITTGFATVAATAAATFSTPDATAANLRLEGFGSFEVSNFVKYFAKPPVQGGRFNRFRGGDFYNRAEIQMDFLENRSSTRSGELSFEFWAMPFFGASSGIVLMTEGLSPIRANRFFRNVTGRGQALNIDERRFPELNIWEFTRSGWRFRDALSFDYRADL